jgi:hypothetical protein
MQLTQEIEQKTGTPNPVYDIVSVMYHALQGAETYDRYIADAEQRGDDELVEFFRVARRHDGSLAVAHFKSP